MKRKVNLVGHSTHTVSLPTKWVKENALQKGDEVEIIEDSFGLRLLSKPMAVTKEVKIDITGMPTSKIWYNVIAAYNSGATEILITHKSSTVQYSGSRLGMRETITIRYLCELIVNHFPNFEMVSDTADVTILREMSSLKETEFQSSLKRMLFLLMEIPSEMKLHFTSNIDELYAASEYRESQVNKFYYMCSRLLNTKGLSNKAHVLPMYRAVCLFEVAADELFDLSRYFVESPIGQGDVVSVMDKLSFFAHLMYGVFFDGGDCTTVNMEIEVYRKSLLKMRIDKRLALTVRTILHSYKEAIAMKLMMEYADRP